MKIQKESGHIMLEALMIVATAGILASVSYVTFQEVEKFIYRSVIVGEAEKLQDIFQAGWSTSTPELSYEIDERMAEGVVIEVVNTAGPLKNPELKKIFPEYIVPKGVSIRFIRVPWCQDEFCPSIVSYLTHCSNPEETLLHYWDGSRQREYASSWHPQPDVSSIQCHG